jgi:hypothetical protein
VNICFRYKYSPLFPNSPVEEPLLRDLYEEKLIEIRYECIRKKCPCLQGQTDVHAVEVYSDIFRFLMTHYDLIISFPWMTVIVLHVMM